MNSKYIRVPYPQVTWVTNEGQVLSYGDKVVPGLRIHEDSLDIAYAEPHMSGTYTCIATNSAGSHDHTFIVSVQGES